MSHPMRRMSDKIIAAHQQAIQEGRRDLAEVLFQALQIEASYIGGKKIERRGEIDDLEAAFVRHFEFTESNAG